MTDESDKVKVDQIRDFLSKKGWKINEVSEIFIHPDLPDGSHSINLETESLQSSKNVTSTELKIVYDYVPWGMMPIYDTEGSYLKNCEVFVKNHALPSTSWLPSHYFTSKEVTRFNNDIIRLNWNSSENPEDIRELCKAAIASKSSNNVNGGTILIGFQDNAKEYRAFVIFTNETLEGFESSTAPDWLKF